ncbi:PLP-dependent aminotransferase family protein [Niveibacterium umoris]|uniref:DNA-binding transcriptional MocR family regulator n=1 Tax=Niveibacterium umoris TaxID=1193620 RepID=A0A840BFG5_9RHOO|nr:PLP-dependent aminotransferase family protein [Niveibacterium umoris]MBB4011413.1 DNA-binding transcriptional MocR family regulator [Niveibacterium umoris]
MTSWRPDLQDVNGPLFLAVVEQLAEAIRSGRLRPGDRLPTHRLMADLLGINVSTVTRAYREAERRRLIGGEVGRGTFVLGAASEARLFAFADRPQDTLIDLSTNTPPGSGDDALSRTVLTMAEEGSLARLVDYPTPGDLYLHQAAAQTWLAMRGIDAPHEALIVCAGAQHAMEAALAAAGEREIGCECLSWPGLKAIARSRDLRLHPLPIDDDGILPEALERAAQHGLRCLVCIPTLHNPTARTSSLERRRAIVEIARRYDLMVIEEDVYGALASEAPVALAALAPERVCHVTGLSKTVSPGLRIGYLLLAPGLVSRRSALEHHTQWYVSPLSAEVARRWISDGTAAQRVAQQRHELGERWKVALTCVGQHQPAGAHESPHLWLPCADARAAVRVSEAARRAGVAVVPSDTFAVGRMSAPAGIRVSLGAASSRSRLREGLNRLAAVL